MSGGITYVLYAIDKPLSRAQRADVQKLSSRVNPSSRRADFGYQVEGYDIPGGYESLLARYYDLMVRQEYELWTLGMAFPYSEALYQSLRPYQCDDGEGCGIRLEKMDARFTGWGQRKIKKPTKMLAEISAYLDYDEAEALTRLRALPWERAPEDEAVEEMDDWEDDWDNSARVNSLDETLAKLTNCIREIVIGGDLRAFYLAWKRLHDPSSPPSEYLGKDAPNRSPKPPPGLKRLPLYLKRLTKMVNPSDER